jgi:glycosyltransferase involved in cell wall biosynthesis
MKRILFITHTLSMGGGAEKVLAMLLGGIAGRYQIDVLERTEDTTHIYELPGVQKLRSMSYTAAAAAKYHKNRFLQRIWLTALKLLILLMPAVIYRKYVRGEYDYEISFNYLFTSFLAAHSKNRNSKKIMWIHGSIEDLEYKQYRGLSRIIYHICFICQKKAFGRADVITAISNKTKQSIETLYPEYKDKITILYNGCDIEIIQKKSLESISNPLSPNNKQNVILGIGKLDKRKNFELLIYAVSRVIHAGIPCSLVLVGDGELRSRLETIAEKEGIAEKVFFAGFEANPYPYFRLAKIVCVSSFAEGFPTVVLEALVLGKPFVTTPVAGASEELSDGGRCGLVSCWDAGEYAACVQRLLADGELYAAMSRNCAEKAKEFSIERFAGNFNNLLQRLENE